jgi:hypothetical protein
LRQPVAEVGDGGVLVGQLALNGNRATERINRLCRLAGVGQHATDAKTDDAENVSSCNDHVGPGR